MYELTCPSCGFKWRLPFVRVGARAICQRCQQPYVVKPELVVRKVAIRELGPGDSDPLMLGFRPSPPAAPAPPAAPTAAPTPPRPAESAAPAPVPAAPAASGASEISGVSGGEPAAPPRPPPAPPVSRLIALHVRRRQRNQVIAWIAALCVLLLFFVIATVLITRSHAPPAVNDNPAKPPPAVVAQIDATRLSEPAWRLVDESYTRVAKEGPAKLIRDTLARGLDDDSYHFTGDVVPTSIQVVEEASIEVVLIDSDEQAFARTQVDLLPLTAQDPASRQALNILVPHNIKDRYKSSDWRLTVAKTMTDGVPLADVHIAQESAGTPIYLRVTGANPLDHPIARIVLGIRGGTGVDNTIRKWRAQWTGTLAPHQIIDMTVAAPAEPGWKVTDWLVTAVGEPLTAASASHSPR